MDAAWWALNAAYAAYVVSPVFKEMLRFGAMHAYQVALLLRERMGVALSEDDDMLRQKLFPTLDPVAFNALWSLGTERTLVPNEVIMEVDADVDEVHLVVSGAVDVDLGDGRFTRLRPHTLVGEMSLLRGGPACATVRSSGPTTIRSFTHADLLKLGEARPAVKDAALMLIGRQLAEKIHADPSLVPA